MLCEAAWVAIRTPGPLRAFYERVRARRGAQIAFVASARKLSVLFWHLLTAGSAQSANLKSPRSQATKIERTRSRFADTPKVMTVAPDASRGALPPR